MPFLYAFNLSFLFEGYRDDSLETVKRNRDQYGIPLKILSYQELYGWTMDQVYHFLPFMVFLTFS